MVSAATSDGCGCELNVPICRMSSVRLKVAMSVKRSTYRDADVLIRTIPSVATSRWFLVSSVREMTSPRSMRSSSAVERLKAVVKNALDGSSVAAGGAASIALNVRIVTMRMVMAVVKTSQRRGGQNG